MSASRATLQVEIEPLHPKDERPFDGPDDAFRSEQSWIYCPVIVMAMSSRTTANQNDQLGSYENHTPRQVITLADGLETPELGRLRLAKVPDYSSDPTQVP